MLHDTGPVSTSRSSVFINPVEHWTSGIEGVRTLTTLQPLSGFPTVVRAHVIVDITFPSFSVRLQLRLLRQRSRSGDGAKTRWTIELRLTFLKRRSPACSQERTSSPTARSRECRDEMEERDQWFTKKCSQDLRIKPRLCTFFFCPNDVGVVLIRFSGQFVFAVSSTFITRVRSQLRPDLGDETVALSASSFTRSTTPSEMTPSPSRWDSPGLGRLRRNLPYFAPRLPPDDA